MYRKPKSPNREQATAAVLREHVRKHCSPGEKLSTVRTLARELGVSLNTVSGALHRLAAAGLVRVRQGDGAYVTGEGLRPRVGVFTAGDITHPRAARCGRHVMHHCLRLLREADLDAALYTGPREPWDYRPNAPWNYLNDIRAANLEGVIACSTPEVARLDLCEEAGIVVVGMSDGFPFWAANDDEGMIRTGARRLIDAGCRRLAMIAWNTDRVQGAFRAELASAGIEIVPDWIRSGNQPCQGGAGWEDFRDLWSASREKPDGLLIADDVFFPDVATAIQELRIKVPEDLEVVTQGNRGIPALYPFPVTVLENDPEAHAQALVNLLLMQLEGRVSAEYNRVLGFSQYQAGPARRSETVSSAEHAISTR